MRTNKILNNYLLKLFLITIYTFVILTGLLGCSDTKSDEVINNIDEALEEVSPSSPEPVVLYRNPVSNLPVAEGKQRIRPIAIMINNRKVATPQEGISRADIWFEMPAEAEVNRIMAVFYDYADIKTIGTVRSARDYFVDFALPLDALYIHYGGSPQFYILDKKINLDDLDGINGRVHNTLFWRDQYRKKNAGYEHSVLTSGEKLWNGIPALGRRNEINEDYKPYFNFNEEDVTPAGTAASTVKIKYSSYISPVFKYNAENKMYLREQYGAPHIDSAYNNEQITVKNILVLKTKVTPISGDTEGRVKVTTTGEGNGFYISNGKALEIIWRKKSREDKLELFDKNNNPLYLNTGKTWVSILSSEPVFE